MRPGDLIRVGRAHTLDADMRRLGFWGRHNGQAFFIDAGTPGMVVEVRGKIYLVTFGDRICWMDELTLEAFNEAR
jgi:hypothetical protein